MKNYEFNFNFGQPWGQCDVTMTSVLGHLSELEFTEAHRKWSSCAPAQLFDAPANVFVKDQVCRRSPLRECFSHVTRAKLLQPILPNKHAMPRRSSSGPIAIAKVNISEPKLEKQLSRVTNRSRSRGPDSAIQREPTLSMLRNDPSILMID